jgi:hypothetical protein
MPKNVDKWLPKFSANNDVLIEGYLSSFYNSLQLYVVQYEHEDVVMRLFSSSLIGDARFWYNNIPGKGIKTWQDLYNAFI